MGNGDVSAGFIDILRQGLFIVTIFTVPIALTRLQAQICLVLHRLSETHEIECIPELRVLYWRLCHPQRLRDSVVCQFPLHRFTADSAGSSRSNAGR